MNETVGALDQSEEIEYVPAAGSGKPLAVTEKLAAGNRKQVADSKEQSSVVRQSSSGVGHKTKWQNILLHEWRNTSDEEYAEHLFKLIADTPVSHEATLINTLMGMVYGGAAGLLLALIGTFETLPQTLSQSSWPLVGIGALAGGGIALARRLLFQRKFTVQHWLAQSTANLSPGELGVVGVLLALQLFGGLAGWTFGLVAGVGNTIGILMMGMTLVIFFGARLVGWLVGFGREPDPKQLHRYRSLWIWWRKRPQRNQIETALRQACAQHPQEQEFWAGVLTALEQRKQETDSIRESIIHLQSLDWIERFTATYLLAASGGEGVTHLHPIATKITSPLRKKAVELLQAIGQETTARLAHRTDRMFCPRCLAFCSDHPISMLDDFDIRYYGCRICKQSRNLWEGEVIAVLDAGMRARPIHKNSKTLVNWLARRELFDFNSVEIVQATDEDVERFAVQVGNDTDPFRRPRYRQMHCVVKPECSLSENTLRILDSVFGQVGRQ